MSALTEAQAALDETTAALIHLRASNGYKAAKKANPNPASFAATEIGQSEAHSVAAEQHAFVTVQLLTPPPPPLVTVDDMKGGCTYSIADAQRGRDVAGLKRVRSDYYLTNTGYAAGVKALGLDLIPVACYSQGLSSQGDHFPPDAGRLTQWARQNANLVATKGWSVVEAWNEPWLSNFWGPVPDPVGYLHLVQALSTEVWALVADCIVLVSMDYWQQGAGAAGRKWAESLIAADTGGFLCDPRIRPTTHNYCGADPPEKDRGLGWSFDRYRLAYDALVAHGHPDPMVWVTEFGWDTKGGGETSPVTEQDQADFTIRAMQMMVGSGKVERACVFQNKPDDWYGIFRPDGSARPVAPRIRALT